MMKTSLVLALAFATTTSNAFVIQGPSKTTTHLEMSVGSKWVTDPVTKCRVEVPEEHYTMRSSMSPEEYWPYNPWGGIGQTMFFPPGAVDTASDQAGLYFPGAMMDDEDSDAGPAQLPEADPTRAMPDTSVSAYEQALKQQTARS